MLLVRLKNIAMQKGKRPPTQNAVAQPRAIPKLRDLAFTRAVEAHLVDVDIHYEIIKASGYGSAELRDASQPPIKELQQCMLGSAKEIYPEGLEILVQMRCVMTPVNGLARVLHNPLPFEASKLRQGLPVDDVVSEQLGRWQVGFVQNNTKGRRRATYRNTVGDNVRDTVRVDITLTKRSWDGAPGSFPWYMRPESLNPFALNGLRTGFSDRPTTVLPLQIRTDASWLSLYEIEEEFECWLAVKPPGQPISFLHRFIWLCKCTCKLTQRGSVLSWTGGTRVLSQDGGQGATTPLVDQAGIPESKVTVSRPSAIPGGWSVVPHTEL